jgi:hypothetical protein
MAEMTGSRTLERAQTFLDVYKRLWRTHPLVAAALTAAVIAVGAFVGSRVAYTRSSNDEPPIRVKGGSIEFELMANAADLNNTWDQDNVQGQWMVHPGRRTRDDDDLGFAVLTTSAKPCPAVAHEVKYVSFTFTDADGANTEDAVTVTANGHKTRVKGQQGHKKEVLNPTGRTLVYGTRGDGGWPSAMSYQLKTGPRVTCNLAQGDTVVILEW